MEQSQKQRERTVMEKSTVELFEAIQRNDVGQVRSLIAEGADVKEANDTGRAPLHEAVIYAAEAGCGKSVVETLLDNGADVDCRDGEGLTPLHYLAESRHALGKDVQRQADEVAKLLIQKGADVNAQDKGGETPLHSASANDAVDIARSLIAAGANSDMENCTGERATDVVGRTTDRENALVDFSLSVPGAAEREQLKAMLATASQGSHANRQSRRRDSGGGNVVGR
jgi:ankyrin repeat protein